jgi:hypothetical protein
MDRLDSAQIGERKSDKCRKCGMHKNTHKCCWDDIKVVKLQTSHVASKGITPEFSLPAVVVNANEFLLSPFYNFTSSNKAIAHGPPLSEQATYLDNCVFRI